MTQELTRKHTTVTDRARALATKASWYRLALAAILILSAFLNLFRLTSAGYGNTYYAAAVKDMLTSWHNFFFVSFDAGFVSVDKPPLGLWIQAASAYLFGFSGLSLLLPQALAGILSVALLYHLVKRTFGPVAGLLSALVLAVTPIAVAVNRANDLDSLLILTVLIGAWLLMRAAQTGRLRWLVAGAVVVGLGFNIKMLEAYLVLPAFYLLYLLAAPLSWRRRLVHLGVATVVLVVVSLSWAVVVDLTPVDHRPYVGSSSNNSELNLILGYNGLDRLFGVSFGSEGSMPAGTPGGPGGSTEMNGEIGPFRLLNEQHAGQIGWLLPLAVVGLLAASLQSRFRLPLDRRRGALVLWGTWLLAAAAYFSVAGGGHPYYTVMLAPAIAALVGIGVVALWSDYRSPGRCGWLLPLTFLGMAALHAYILSDYEDWSLWLTPVILGLCLVAALGLLVLRLRPKLSAYSTGMVAIGVLALLIAPTVWAVYTTWEGGRGFLPVAGPRASQAFPGPPGGRPPGGGPPGGGPPGGGANPALINYLLANQGGARYLVAATNAMSTAPIILNTDEPVISLGGYNGVDPVFTTSELAQLVDKGAVRFFLIPDRESGQRGAPPGAPQGGPRGGPGAILENELTTWVRDSCEQVPQEEWQPYSISGQGGGPGGMRAQALYDCGTREG